MARPLVNHKLTMKERLADLRAKRHANEVKKLTELFGIITTCVKIYSGNADLYQLCSILQQQIYDTTQTTYINSLVAKKQVVNTDYPKWFTFDCNTNKLLTLEEQDQVYMVTLFFLHSLQLPKHSLKLRQSYLAQINFTKIASKFIAIFYKKAKFIFSIFFFSLLQYN